jgi:hypothetical protein
MGLLPHWEAGRTPEGLLKPLDRCSRLGGGLVVICNLGSACACRRLQYYCTVPLHWQTGRLADWRTGAHGSLVRLGIPGFLDLWSNERPAALDPDRATGPWVSSLFRLRSPSGGGGVFPRRETSDSQTATTMRPMPKPMPIMPITRTTEASPQPSPMLIADC